MKIIKLPQKIERPIIPSYSDSTEADKIKETIEKCTSALLKVSKLSNKIIAQGGWDAFWSKAENIRKLANNFVELSGVQQTVLDLLVLLMGAAGGMKKDYDMIIKTIEELSQVHSGNVEVLKYILKIKKSVNELKRRDELLDALVTFTNDLRDTLNELNKEIYLGINSINSSISELNIRQNNTDITITKINNSIENTKIDFDKMVKERHQDVLNTLSELQISQSKEYKKLESQFRSNRKYLIILVTINVPLIILLFYLLSRI